ncbi:MAG TPA: hypothetical protein PLY16_02965 [Candidatus Saccharibacteria bacterium]|nr:hypothetical protein [Candidatus Saccharibacteria bacterium]
MKQVVQKLETAVAQIVKPIPHLPAKGQKWFADNVWWIVLVGAILGGIALLFAIVGLFQVISLMNAFNYYAYSYIPAHQFGSGMVFASVVSVVTMVVTVGLFATAIKPLMNKAAKGWHLLFIAVVVGAILSLVNGLIMATVGSFIVTLIMTAISFMIGSYFLFEIRSHFVRTADGSKKPAAKKKA